MVLCSRVYNWPEQMKLRKLTPLILRICVALIAVAVLFSAPASHAAYQPCSSETSAILGHSQNGDHHSQTKVWLGNQACCSSICLLIFPSPNASLSVSIQVSQASDLQARLIGRVPSPGLKPPQSVA